MKKTLLLITTAIFLISALSVNGDDRACCMNTYTGGVFRPLFESACCANTACQYYADCYEYEGGIDFPLDGEGGVHACYTCVQVCQAEKEECTANSDCCSGYYCSSGHCCGVDSSWDAIDKVCVDHAPCYSSTSSLLCMYLAPNSPSPQSSWWGNPFNANCIPSDLKACCYVGAGLYGHTSTTDPFYYWHERNTVTVY